MTNIIILGFYEWCVKNNKPRNERTAAEYLDHIKKEKSKKLTRRIYGTAINNI